MARRHVVVAAAILAGGFCFLGNPPPLHHERAIRSAFREAHPLFEPLGVDVSAAFLPKYRSLLVASFTARERSVTSVGVLGRVWVFPSAFGDPIEPAPGSAVVTPDSVRFAE